MDIPSVDPIKIKETRDRWRRRNPQKVLIEQRLTTIARTRYPITMPCEKCGSILLVERHHPDRDEPLKIEWLCKYHHEITHHGIMQCKTAGCKNKHCAKGLCRLHWKRQRRLDPLYKNHVNYLNH